VCGIQDRVKVIVRIVKVVWWPNAFTPNRDGTNDVWNIKGKRISSFCALNIYNRWGESVYAAQNIKDGNADPSMGWDGKFKGEKALPEAYVFYTEVEYMGLEVFDKYKGSWY
jgi:gliding motility-associated-like protein